MSNVSIRVAVHEAVPERQPQDAQVEPRRPVRDVVEVELDAFSQRRVAAPAVDLGPARDAGFDGVASVIVRNRLGELIDEDGPFWPWPNQAHVAQEDVDELRQLIQT